MMNTKIIISALAISLCLFSSCEKNTLVKPEIYACGFEHEDVSEMHPKAAIYQSILDKNRKLGLVGTQLMIKDKHGIWLGASGKADIASNIDVEPCSQFLIASISKSFTATVVLSLVDDGLLSLDDPVTQWINKTITDKVANTEESTIRHLLNHTSGIPDYQTLQYELDRINQIDNGWFQEDILKYTYGKKATHEVGQTYYYSNTNFLLLGMIIEAASEKSLEAAYRDFIFQPLGLSSAHYSTSTPIPDQTVKGYVDIYGNGHYVESEFLYKDELNTGDGGIAINAYDLGVFYEKLMKGALVSDASLQQMTTYEDLPSDWVDEDFGHFQNGLGLEHNKTAYGLSVGHTGGIDGFLSIAQYFPEADATFVLLVNSGSYENLPRLNIYQECLEEMFN